MVSDKLDLTKAYLNFNQLKFREAAQNLNNGSGQRIVALKKTSDLMANGIFIAYFKIEFNFKNNNTHLRNFSTRTDRKR